LGEKKNQNNNNNNNKKKELGGRISLASTEP
jgi:hypothetical protein